MANLVAVAERLRTVKAAQKRFLAMFAVECMEVEAAVTDKLGRDLERLGHGHRPEKVQRTRFMDDEG